MKQFKKGDKLKLIQQSQSSMVPHLDMNRVYTFDYYDAYCQTIAIIECENWYRSIECFELFFDSDKFYEKNNS